MKIINKYFNRNRLQNQILFRNIRKEKYRVNYNNKIRITVEVG